MIDFGLEGTRLGIFLVLVNLVIFTLAAMFAYKKFAKQRKLKKDKEWKVYPFSLHCLCISYNGPHIYPLYIFHIPLYYVRHLAQKMLEVSVPTSSVAHLIRFGKAM
jgi:hypothetical protein